MTVNVTFQMQVFNGGAFLAPVLSALLKVGRVICVEGPVKYWQDRGYKTSTDDTNDILQTLLPARDILHGTFAEKDEMMQAGARLIPPDSQFVWMCDSDEAWSVMTLHHVIAELDNYDAVSFKPFTFYGSLDRCMGGYEERVEWTRIQRWYAGATWHSHRPPTVLAPDGVPYVGKRHWNAEQTAAAGYRFHHYSYVMPTQVKAKIQYYTSWGAGVIGSYFERVYKPWTLGDSIRRREIENEFDGVHEFIPSRRGDARTYPFEGQHPRHIDRMLPALKRRLAWEIAEMKAGRI